MLKEQTENNKLLLKSFWILKLIPKKLYRTWNVCHYITEQNSWSKTHSKWNDLPETIKYNSSSRETLVHQLTTFNIVWLGKQSRVATQKSCDHYNAFKLLNITRKILLVLQNGKQRPGHAVQYTTLGFRSRFSCTITRRKR